MDSSFLTALLFGDTAPVRAALIRASLFCEASLGVLRLARGRLTGTIPWLGT
jgi:hypothetical protein